MRQRLSELQSIFQLFSNSVKQYPGNTALVVDGQSFSYRQLVKTTLGLTKKLNQHNAGQRIGIYAHRTAAAYIGVLGILASGRTYVPLNPKFPANRNSAIVQSAGINHIVCDSRYVNEGFLRDSNFELITLSTQTDEDIEASVKNEEMTNALPPELKNSFAQQENTAYIMFTSGTTGTPKGVPITHENVLNYVDNVLNLIKLTENDRFSQTFDLTFDLSVHDLFVCWAVGGSLHVLPAQAVMAPAKFIKEHELSIWFSVPSTIGFMLKLRMLKPGAFPTLRCSWFCGEALPAKSAILWQAAAPKINY